MKARALHSTVLIIALILSSAPVSRPREANAQDIPTEIIVTNNSDVSDGDTSSVEGLTADPGNDGISLREAIEATNHDPSTYKITFDPSISGQTITISGPPEAIPLMLTGGGVTIDGDIDGDGAPDVTITPEPSPHQPSFMTVSSSGNRLHALAVRGFSDGVMLQPAWHPDFPGDWEFPTNQTYTDNVISGLVVDVEHWGISIYSGVNSSDCGSPGTQIPCQTHNRWVNTTITGNTIEAGDKGIQLFLIDGLEDGIEGVTITDNAIRMVSQSYGDSILIGIWGNATRNSISDMLIASNDIEGLGDQSGVFLVNGPPVGNTIEGVRIVDNRIRLGTEGGIGWGITLQAGECHEAVDALCSGEGNVVRDVAIKGNSIVGSMQSVVFINGGIGSSGQNNRVSDIRIVGNVLRSVQPTFGVNVSGSEGSAPEERPTTGIRITRLVIRGNRIRIGTGPDFGDAGAGVGAAGVALLGGHMNSRENTVRNVRIAKNSIRTAYVGIKVIGGVFQTAQMNRVSCVPRHDNRIIDARKKIVVRSDLQGATGNKARLGC